MGKSMVMLPMLENDFQAYHNCWFIWSPLYNWNFCGCWHGIFGSCPFEHLHAWQARIMKDGMRLLFLLGDLPSSFIKWYKTQRGDWPPVTKMTDSQLYINKPKFEATLSFSHHVCTLTEWPWGSSHAFLKQCNGTDQTKWARVPWACHAYSHCFEGPPTQQAGTTPF